ncbi:MAG: hypothetical protein FGF51_07570 [Candidatus Brockarchaeota archaeon]|nr:hypothetical protein [Candidatus Brockarchaeota archaeon]
MHLSEIVNILKHGMPVEELNKLIISLFMLDNVEMYGVVKETYFAAARATLLKTAS